MPCISVLGLILCSLSAFIFFHRKFKDPVFFYYRLICLLYIFHLLIGIPYGLVYSPRYFRQLNTYISSYYLGYYIVTTVFLYHFEDTLQMAILIDRMKIFSPYVKKKFSSSPRVISLAFFFTCLCIGVPLAFAAKVVSFGTYFTDESKEQQHVVTFYYFTTSDFGSSLLGRILLGFTSFFLNTFLPLFVGVTFNITSV